MKEVNPDGNTEIAIDAQGNKVKLSPKMMKKVKEAAKTGDNEEVIVAIKSTRNT